MKKIRMYSSIDTIAHTNSLRYSDTRLKVMFALLTLLITVASTSPIPPVLVFTITSLLILFVAKVKPKTYLLLLLIPFLFGLTALILMSMLFGYHNPYSFEIFSHTLTIYSDGLNMGLLVTTRALAASSCLFFLALTTPMTELFAGLRWLGIPTAIVEIAMLIYRYIFVFLEESERMWIASKMRGEGDFRTRIRVFSMLAGTLFLRSIQQGEKLIVAMNSRCYQGEISNLACLKNKKRINPVVFSAIMLFELALAYVSFKVI